MTQNIKNQLAIMSERICPSHVGHMSLAELRAYQSAWLDGAFACLALISREHLNNNKHKESKREQVE